MLRVFAAASTVLGVLTGLGTVVGWIGSGSFEDTVNWVFPLAGWAFFAYSSLLPIVELPYKGFVKHEFRWFQVPWFLLGVLMTALIAVTTPTFVTDESFRKDLLIPGLMVARSDHGLRGLLRGETCPGIPKDVSGLCTTRQGGRTGVPVLRI